MNESTIYDITQRHPEAFSASGTLAQFAANIGGKYGDFLAKYGEPQSWASRYYATIKAHGFMPRALQFPDIRKASDLFESVHLASMATDGHAPSYFPEFVFVSTSRNPGFAYFGPIGARYSWSPEWLNRAPPERIRRQSGGATFLTAGKPCARVAEEWHSGDDEWKLSTLECIGWEDGRTLVVGRSRNGFSNAWVCLLDAGESVYPMLPEADRERIAAEKAKQAAAWGNQ